MQACKISLIMFDRVCVFYHAELLFTKTCITVILELNMINMNHLVRFSNLWKVNGKSEFFKCHLKSYAILLPPNNILLNI